MRRRLLAKEAFVVPLHLGHRKQLLDVLVAACDGREARGMLVLADVLALEAARAVHGQEPAPDAAEQGDRPADTLHLAFAARIRSGAERGEHPTQAPPVPDLVAQDLPQLGPFGARAQRGRMPGVGPRRAELARVRQLEEEDEVCARGGCAYVERDGGDHGAPSVPRRRRWIDFALAGLDQGVSGHFTFRPSAHPRRASKIACQVGNEEPYMVMRVLSAPIFWISARKT